MLWAKSNAVALPRRFAAVLFDLDGTLIDSSPDLTVSLNVALREHGLPERTSADVRRFVGDGARQLVARSLPPDREALVDPVLARFRKHYGEHLLVRTRVYEGITEVLDALRHLPLGVVSNKPEAFVRRIIMGLGWGGRFRALMGGDSLAVRKPNPQVLVEACRLLSAPAAESLMVGDGVQDVVAARAAGLTSCGAAWGFRGAEMLHEAGADYAGDSPRELLALVAA